MDKSTKRGLIKSLGTFLGSCCVSYTIDQLVKSNTNPATKAAALAIKIGGLVVSGMVASKADDYIAKQFDQCYGLLDILQGAGNGKTQDDPVQ